MAKRRDNMIQRQLVFDEELWREIQKAARLDDSSASRWIRQAAREKIDRDRPAA